MALDILILRRKVNLQTVRHLKTDYAKCANATLKKNPKPKKHPKIKKNPKPKKNKPKMKKTPCPCVATQKDFHG